MGGERSRIAPRKRCTGQDGAETTESKTPTRKGQTSMAEARFPAGPRIQPMMDRQHGGKIIFECDSCDETLETETKDFDDARLMLESEGWKARNIADVWLHGCPKCGVPA